MISAACDLCGGTTHREIGTGKRFNLTVRVVVCLDCGLVFQNPRMTEEELADFYRDRYRDVYSGSSAEPPADFVAAQVSHGKRMLDDVARYLLPGSSVLDIGCGPGGTLVPFMERGFAVMGIEPGRYAEWGRNHLGIDVREAAFETCELGSFQPDAILLSFVLEHVNSPAGVLRRARSLLSPEGLLYVEVPNIRGIRGPTSRYFHIAHLTYFSPATLVGLLRICGFDPVSVVATRAYNMSVVARRSTPIDVALPIESAEEIVTLLRKHERIASVQEFAKRLLRPAGSAAAAAARAMGGPEAEVAMHAKARRIWARARYGD